ncbi:MAG: hypothetical protein AB203_00275 [Parcubacteria bacterium C7867-008]|nr:MAG: hypothetical protein AB203_00275 [Parcubacteria bacterium C7867-008]
MLKSICERQLGVASMSLQEMGIEVQQLSDPKFLEEKLREEKAWSGDPSQSPGTINDLLSQIEEDSQSLRLIKISTEDEYRRIFDQVRGLVQMMFLIIDENYSAIIEVLKRCSQSDRTGAATCQRTAETIPFLSNGQKTIASMLEFNAQFCDFLITILEFEGNFEFTPPS